MSFLPVSSPPSRQSDRRSPQPSPIPDTYTSVPADEDPSTDHDPQGSEAILPPPNFAPYFTLLTNPTSSTTHHPTVQYIFSDDTPDTEPITSAALQVLDPKSPTSSPKNRRSDGEQPTERFVLIDMDATGTKVLSAQSMSSDWAVTSTELGPAPTWDKDGQGMQEEGGDEGEEEERGLMLRIEGLEVLGTGAEGEWKGKGRGDGEDKRLDELVDVYERTMGELRRVVDAGAGVGLGTGTGLGIEERRGV